MTNIDEKIVWQGAPKQGLVFSSLDFFLVPFSFMWTGIFIWIAISSGGNSPIFFRIIPIFFLVFGVYVSIGRFVHDVLIRKNTKYYVTVERIVIDIFGKRTSIKLGNISTLILEESKNDANILFANKPIRFGRGMNMYLPSQYGIPMFFRISDYKDVYKFLTNHNVT